MIRHPIQKMSTGQDEIPGMAHAVLYSLQRMTGRSCDFQQYVDTEVLMQLSSTS